MACHLYCDDATITNDAVASMHDDIMFVLIGYTKKEEKIEIAGFF